MHFIQCKPALIAAICVAVSQTAGVSATPKSSDSGVEYVKACDSGPDDVTNQCINRIPEDVGMDSGNHACAYHEAEVKCLGLCGNTVTWKTSYKNALKRYRLVCARFIEERLADKEEEEEANGGNDSPPSPPRKKADTSDSSSSEDSQAGDAGDSSPKGIKHKQPSGSSDDSKNGRKGKKESAEPSATQSQKAKASGSKASPSATDSAAHAKSASPSQKAQSSLPKGSSTNDIGELISNIGSALDSSQAKERPADAKNGSPGGKEHASNTEGDKEKRIKAMLPTMDPEIAGSPHAAHALTVCNCLLILSASLAYMLL
ncbi:hypothetical protein EV175_001560 [Coemansia sp. RSA 1933]|nr:hypothetical protein EV175_001560 [Coemansia sp. RSA 1933]